MSLLRWLAAPLAPLYAGVVKARSAVFDAHPERARRLGIPVLSIGNLSTGGTGKTPVTLFLAERLGARGWRPVVLSRGYGGRRTVDPLEVQPDASPAACGDEPVLMARRLGRDRVVVARKRVAGALRALTLDPAPDLLLLDDGFQHRALHRDLDLLLLDGVRRWGNGRMLPFGDLREPMTHAKRAHALVVTRGGRAPREEIEAWWARHGSGGPVFFVDFRIGALRRWPDGERLTLPSSLPPALAFAALGHPEAFFADLLVAGVPWVATRTYRDHQSLSPRELLLLEGQARAQGAECLVCTEKDAVKFGRDHALLGSLPLWVAEQEVVGGEALLEWVVGRLARPATAP